jgi:hypothetical protein
VPLVAALLHLQRPVTPSGTHSVAGLWCFWKGGSEWLLSCTQPQSEGFGSSGSDAPGSLISTPGTCRDSVTSCEWMEDGESGTGSWIQPGNHLTVCTPMYLKLVSVPRAIHIFPGLDLQECIYTQYHNVRVYLASLSYSPSELHLTHAEHHRAPLFHELHRFPCHPLLAHMSLVERKLHSSVLFSSFCTRAWWMSG